MQFVLTDGRGKWDNNAGGLRLGLGKRAEGSRPGGCLLLQNVCSAAVMCQFAGFAQGMISTCAASCLPACCTPEPAMIPKPSLPRRGRQRRRPRIARRLATVSEACVNGMLAYQHHLQLCCRFAAASLPVYKLPLRPASMLLSTAPEALAAGPLAAVQAHWPGPDMAQSLWLPQAPSCSSPRPRRWWRAPQRCCT